MAVTGRGAQRSKSRQIPLRKIILMTVSSSAGTLTVEGGVPVGVAASAPVTLTAAPAMATACRERFANGLRIYGIDQGKQREHAGRLCAYLRVPRSRIARSVMLSNSSAPDSPVLRW